MTQNLARILRGMRDHCEPQKLWVDQISINQEDNRERSAQVKIMRFIFSGSRRVIAMLGPDANHQGHSAAQIIALLAENGIELMKSIVRQNTRVPNYFPEDALLESHCLPTRDSPLWQALRGFLQNVYFERVWIIQELRVCPSAILRWGDTTIKYLDLERAMVSGEPLELGSQDAEFHGVPESFAPCYSGE